jgi:hypothetical protein
MGSFPESFLGKFLAVEQRSQPAVNFSRVRLGITLAQSASRQ